MPSYASGTSTVPLLGDTIGDNFRRTVAAYGDRDGAVDRGSGRRFTYAELGDTVEALAAGLVDAGVGKGDRVGIWSPNRWEWTALQYATADIGAILVTINPAYRTHELEYVLKQAGIIAAGGRAGLQDQRLPGDGRRGPRTTARTCASVVFFGDPEWEALLTRGDRGGLAEIRAGLSFDDPINIQYTSGTTGFPKGATLSHHNILNNGFFVGELCSYTEEDRICIPVPFYHCFGMVMGNLAATSHGACMVIPAPGFDPRATLEAVAAERCTSLYGVPTMFIAELADAVLRLARPVLAADRDHGRLAVPGRGDEAGHRRHGHDRGDHLLRDDRDLAGVHPDPGRRRPGPPGVDGRPGAPARRGQGGRPGHRPGGAARHPRRAVHPGVLGDARLLGGAGEDRGGARRGPAGCTPATSR